MPTQTYVFGGQPAQPSMVSYSALALTADTLLQWPWIDQNADTVAPLWLDVTPSGAFSIYMPNAMGAGNGQASIFFNVGPSLITILDASGGAITTVASGVAKYILLRDNSTPGGLWRVTVLGAGTSSADAAALAGYGLSALGGAKLNSDVPVVAVVSNTNITVTSRAQIFEVTSATGAGTLSFDPVGTLKDGFWIGFTNLGTGAWTLNPNGSEQIDGQTSISLNPSESCFIFCSGGALYTVGRGRSVNFVYTALNKDVSGSSDVMLTATEAGNLLIKFFGTLTGNIAVIVPAVVNEYLVNNATSGAFTLTVKAPGGTGTIAPQGEQTILKCDGTNVQSAFTVIPPGSLSMADGSESAPGLAFALEPTTGFYRPAAGQLGFVVLANEIFQANATGLTVNNLPITGLANGSGSTDALTYGQGAKLAVANIFTANQTVESADAGATLGPVLTLWRNSASPAASDVLGFYALDGQNSTPAQITYAGMQATILDATAASEDSTFDFLTRVAGALAKRGSFGAGFMVGTGATDNGAGTITALNGLYGAAAILAGTASTLATLTQTDAGATVGPAILLDRLSASPAAADVIGGVVMSGRNSTAATKTYAQVLAEIVDATSTSEDGLLGFWSVIAGTLAKRANVGAGLYMTGATGGDQGVGTINATDVKINGVSVGSSRVVVQKKVFETGAVNTGTSLYSYTDSIPSAGDGDLYMTLAFTPTSLTNRLFIQVVFIGTVTSSLTRVVSTLCRSGSASALAVGLQETSAGGQVSTVAYNHDMLAPSTSSITFTVRGGGTNSGTMTFNGAAGNRLFGGAFASSISIEEYVP